MVVWPGNVVVVWPGNVVVVVLQGRVVDVVQNGSCRVVVVWPGNVVEVVVVWPGSVVVDKHPSGRSIVGPTYIERMPWTSYSHLVPLHW